MGAACKHVHIFAGVDSHRCHVPPVEDIRPRPPISPGARAPQDKATRHPPPRAPGAGEPISMRRFAEGGHRMHLRTKLARSCAAESRRPTSLPHRIIRMPRPTYLRIKSGSYTPPKPTNLPAADAALTTVSTAA